LICWQLRQKCLHRATDFVRQDDLFRGGVGGRHVCDRRHGGYGAASSEVIGNHVMGNGEQPGSEGRGVLTIARKSGQGLGKDLRRGVSRRFRMTQSPVAVTVDRVEIVSIEWSKGAGIGLRERYQPGILLQDAGDPSGLR
jgi:hypothetical protein